MALVLVPHKVYRVLQEMSLEYRFTPPVLSRGELASRFLPTERDHNREKVGLEAVLRPTSKYKIS